MRKERLLELAGVEQLNEQSSVWVINQFDAGQYLGSVGPFASVDEARKFIRANPDAFPYENDIDRPIPPAQHIKDMAE